MQRWGLVEAAGDAAGVLWWNTVKGCTDAVQPVDAGLVGRELKRLIGQISADWLDTSDNLDRWEGVGNTKPLAAWERAGGFAAVLRIGVVDQKVEFSKRKTAGCPCCTTCTCSFEYIPSISVTLIQMEKAFGGRGDRDSDSVASRFLVCPRRTRQFVELSSPISTRDC